MLCPGVDSFGAGYNLCHSCISEADDKDFFIQGFQTQEGKTGGFP